VEHFQHELKHLRTGRASLSLLDGITVDYYGSQVPLNQVANLSVADASMIVAQPYDPSQSSAIERAIMRSDLGLNPSSDGKIIRIPLPALTEERRKEIAKQVKTKGEEHKVAIRNERRDANEKLKSLLKDKKITEDENKRTTDRVQKETDGGVTQVDQIVAKKEKEVMEV
jgi:ribosome recycling factor